MQNKEVLQNHFSKTTCDGCLRTPVETSSLSRPTHRRCQHCQTVVFYRCTPAQTSPQQSAKNQNNLLVAYNFLSLIKLNRIVLYCIYTFI